MTFIRWFSVLFVLFLAIWAQPTEPAPSLRSYFAAARCARMEVLQ